MGKFRDNTGVVLWILIGSFGLLWVVMDVFDPNALTAGPRSLGTVNGEPISFEEYNERIQYYSNAYTQQTGASMSAEMRAVYETQVWEDLVSSKLLKQKMDELGITVTDQELIDMAYGDNPDPIIRQYFGRQDGTIDRFVVENVLSSGEYTQEALAIELQLRQKRRQQKLTNFITAGLQVTQEDIIEEFRRRNSFAEFSFVRFSYNEIEESEITVSDAEVRAYYNENKESYKRQETYRAKFVSFSTRPTREDTAAIREEVAGLRADFASTTEDSLFLIQWQSTTGYNNVFVDEDEIREEYRPVVDLNVGEVTELIDLGSSAAIIKKTGEQGNEVRFAVLSRDYEALPSTIDDAAEKADEFEFFATEETSFEEEAERGELAVQEIFATKGNPFVSGLGQSSQQTLNFFRDADEGDISTPIELQNQFVVIKLEEKTEEGYRPLEEVRTQIETQVRNQKRKEATVAKVNEMLASNSSLESLASASGKEVQSMDNLAASSTVITGAGREPGVIGAIFAMESGQTSKAIEGISGAFVIRVSNLSEPQASTLDQATARTIRAELEQQVQQRYLATWLEQLKAEADITDNRDRLIQ